jgi:hypothetical protein
MPVVNRRDVVLPSTQTSVGGFFLVEICVEEKRAGMRRFVENPKKTLEKKIFGGKKYSLLHN